MVDTEQTEVLPQYMCCFIEKCIQSNLHIHLKQMNQHYSVYPSIMEHKKPQALPESCRML